jgi:hypothetical protein
MSLTREDLEDIKQLVQAVVSQQMAEQNKEIKEIKQLFETQDEKLDEIMNAVGTDLNRHSAALDDHDTRIKRLEQKAA